MKVVTARDKLLTNYEVLEHIAQTKQRHRQRPEYIQSQNLETILLEVQSYLRDRPTGKPGQEQSKERIQQAVRELVPMNLEKAEILQIINTAPSSQPVLYTVIEECEARLTPEQQERIMELSGELLGEEPVPETAE